MSVQDRTLQQYHQWMQLNAASHLIRTARETGAVAELREGQRTLEQLCDKLSLLPEATALLLDGLVAIGFVEQYGDDFALARAAHLLCQYDEDLGDRRWQQLSPLLRDAEDRMQRDDRLYFDYLAATQWVHTSAAMEAAEMLDVGGEQGRKGLRILDLGCGSAVWSCALAYRDPESRVTAVDQAAALEAATATADSIGLLDRFEMIDVDDPVEAELPAEEFGLTLLAQRWSALSDEAARPLLDKAFQWTRPGGQLVIIDAFRGPTRPNLSESVEALALRIGTSGGRVRTLDEAQKRLEEAGWRQVEFSFLPASRVNLGMAVGKRPQ